MASIEARVAWALLWAGPGDVLAGPGGVLDDLAGLPTGSGGVLAEPAGADYAGILEGMEARELLALMEQVQARLQALGAAPSGKALEAAPSEKALGAAPSERAPRTRDAKATDSKRKLNAHPSEKPSSHNAPTKLFITPTYTIRTDTPTGPEIPLRPLVKALFILFLKHPEGIRLKERDRYRGELEEIYGIIAPGVSLEDVQKRVQRLVDPADNSFSEKASVLNARLDELFPKSVANGYKIQGFNGHPRRIPLAELAVEWI